jgi:hypothetical protein
LIELIVFASAFGAVVALARARAPFAAWSEATGTRTTRFLPIMWLRIARGRPSRPELESAWRAARFWIGAAIVFLTLGLGLAVAAVLMRA